MRRHGGKYAGGSFGIATTSICMSGLIEMGIHLTFTEELNFETSKRGNLQSCKIFVCLIIWAGAKQYRSLGAEQTTQVRLLSIARGR